MPRCLRELDLETKELVEAALLLEECACPNSGRSQFVSENGRHGKSPWAEFVTAVRAYKSVQTEHEANPA